MDMTSKALISSFHGRINCSSLPAEFQSGMGRCFCLVLKRQFACSYSLLKMRELRFPFKRYRLGNGQVQGVQGKVCFLKN